MIGCPNHVVQMCANDARSKSLQPPQMRIKSETIQSFCMAYIKDEANPVRPCQRKQFFQFIRAGKFVIVIAVLNSKADANLLGIRKQFSDAFSDG